MKFNPGRKIWIAATVAVIVLSLIATGRNLMHALSIRRQIRVLDYDRDFYRQKIERDSILLERLEDDDFLEQYAREHFHMQRRGEKIYLLEE